MGVRPFKTMSPYMIQQHLRMMSSVLIGARDSAGMCTHKQLVRYLISRGAGKVHLGTGLKLCTGTRQVGRETLNTRHCI
jgi:hypothetical protein